MPSLPLSSSMLLPSGREKRPRSRCAVKDGPVIRPQSRGRRHRCRCRRPCRRPHAPSPPFCPCRRPGGWPWPIPRHVLRPDGIVIVNRRRCPRRRCTASMTRRRRLILPGMPPTTIVMPLEAMDEEFCELPPCCFLGVSLASSPFAASPEDDVAAFVRNRAAGLHKNSLADTSLADCLFWPNEYTHCQNW